MFYRNHITVLLHRERLSVVFTSFTVDKSKVSVDCMLQQGRRELILSEALTCTRLGATVFHHLISIHPYNSKRSKTSRDDILKIYSRI